MLTIPCVTNHQGHFRDQLMVAAVEGENNIRFQTSGGRSVFAKASAVRVLVDQLTVWLTTQDNGAVGASGHI